MRKMIGKEVENKEIGNNIEILVDHNSAISNPDLSPVIPEIPSGITGQTRLGDRIKPKSLVVRGIISVRPSEAISAINKALLVRVIIASQKDVKVGSQVGSATDTAHLLKAAVTGADEIPFNGNRNELLYPLNDNKFKRYFDKTFLIAPCAVAGVEQQPRSYFSFQYVFKKLPAHLSFDDGNGNWANNFAPFFCLGYAYADGTAPDVANLRVSSDVYSHLTYEDA